mmetsp:Transcript_20677/g.50792  ORF Transcript_20677/g.50792 Transcript_20677/m.50792 type:complete len:355 (-) Transcript_20677:15-1079(-)
MDRCVLILGVGVAGLNHEPIGALHLHARVEALVDEVNEVAAHNGSRVPINNHAQVDLLIDGTVNVELGVVRPTLLEHKVNGRPALELRKVIELLRHLVRELLDHQLLQIADLVENRALLLLHRLILLPLNHSPKIAQVLLDGRKQLRSLRLLVSRHILEDVLGLVGDDVGGLAVEPRDLAPLLSLDLPQRLVHAHLQLGLDLPDRILVVDGQCEAEDGLGVLVSVLGRRPARGLAAGGPLGAGHAAVADARPVEHVEGGGEEEGGRHEAPEDPRERLRRGRPALVSRHPHGAHGAPPGRGLRGAFEGGGHACVGCECAGVEEGIAGCGHEGRGREEGPGAHHPARLCSPLCRRP